MAKREEDSTIPSRTSNQNDYSEVLSSMKLIRCLMPLFLSIIEMVISNLSGKMDFQEFQRLLADKLNEVGREILKQVLQEMDQQVRQDKTKRQGWQICRTGDRKEIVTCFGAVSYERMYRHTKTRQYAYLVDDQVGYTAHMRVDHNVKAKLVECAADVSYRKSAMTVAEACGGVLLSELYYRQYVSLGNLGLQNQFAGVLRPYI